MEEVKNPKANFSNNNPQNENNTKFEKIPNGRFSRLNQEELIRKISLEKKSKNNEEKQKWDEEVKEVPEKEIQKK